MVPWLVRRAGRTHHPGGATCREKRPAAPQIGPVVAIVQSLSLPERFRDCAASESVAYAWALSWCWRFGLSARRREFNLLSQRGFLVILSKPLPPLLPAG